MWAIKNDQMFFLNTKVWKQKNILENRVQQNILSAKQKISEMSPT
jgi:hypothetical protein